MEPSEPQFDCSVLWTVTGSRGSGGCLVSSLKRRRSTFFFPPLYSVIWSILNKFNPHPLNETITSLSEIWDSESLSASSSLSQSLSSLPQPRSSLPSQLSPDRSSLSRSSLPLSHSHFYLSPSSSSQLTLCLVIVAVVWYFILFNSSFFYVNLYFMNWNRIF